MAQIAFSKWNTNFFGRDAQGKLKVYMHYPQAGRTITMWVAQAVEVKPGVWVRDNRMTSGQSRFPKRYTSEWEALRGMVSRGNQLVEFLLDQSALPVKDKKVA